MLNFVVEEQQLLKNLKNLKLENTNNGNVKKNKMKDLIMGFVTGNSRVEIVKKKEKLEGTIRLEMKQQVVLKTVACKMKWNV